MRNLIELSDISKSFGASLALDHVSLALRPGTVHALVGENGAGKSTLMKVLAGVHQPDEGAILRDGHPITFANPRDALDFGVSTVFQELSLLPNLTIAENMFLGREPTTKIGTIDYARINAETRRALDDVGLDLDPRTPVSRLSIAQRQFVEIAHGIKADASIFILDEPTAALNAADVEILNRHIRRLRNAGRAIVYISHRMEEIFAICDTVSVLKDGRMVGTRAIGDLDPQSLIAMMVGREPGDLFPPRSGIIGDTILDVRDFRIEAASRPFSLSVRRGEIVALAGLEGQGQQKFLRALVGMFRPAGGTVAIGGRPLHLPASPEHGVRRLRERGAGFVPEDRKQEGLFFGLSIARNIAMGLQSISPGFSRADPCRDAVSRAFERMRIKAAGSRALPGSLSGGNQQKVLLARYLAQDLELLLVEEPTRGVDVGAKADIYHLLREFALGGGAVLVLSRDTLELIGLSDRICVVHADTIIAELPARDATEHGILDVALGASRTSMREETP